MHGRQEVVACPFEQIMFTGTQNENHIAGGDTWLVAA